MKFHYNGKYDGNPDNLPNQTEYPNAVQFKEPEDTNKLGLIANGIAVVLVLICVGIGVLVKGRSNLWNSQSIWSYLLMLLPIFTILPHELLHASCFKEDVYMYTNFSNGLAFVVGNELMSKSRFIFMCLLPNIVFGFVPYIIGLVVPKSFWLVWIGSCGIAAGAGDYYNVINALRQMPKGAKTYMKGFHSYWVKKRELKT